MPQEEMRRTLPNYFFNNNFMEVVLKERDHVITQLLVRPESCNPYGRTHGGAIYTLGDSASGTAVHTDGRLYVTQTSTVHFLRNVTPGHTIQAEAKIIHRGKATCLSEVTFTDEENNLLALGQYTFFCINQDPGHVV